jgi:hypothetical protein
MTRFTADMTFQPIKVVRRRRLDTKRAKRQQTRRKDNLFKKALEYSLECGAYVYLAIKIKKNGRIFTFNSDSAGEWPLPEAHRKILRFLRKVTTPVNLLRHQANNLLLGRTVSQGRFGYKPRNHTT